MFCERCGKSFDGEGTLCNECAAGAASTSQIPEVQSSVLPPVFEMNNAQVNMQQVQQVPNEQQVQQVPNEQQASPAAEEAPFVLNSPATPQKKKRRFNGKLVAIIAAVAALIGGACFFFFFTDAGKYMTSSPEKYLQEVQKEEVSTYIDTATNIYGSFLEAPTSTATSGEIRLQVGDAFFDIASMSGAPVDQLNWLRDIRISADSNFAENAYQAKCRFSLGETEIAQTDVIMDMMTSRLFMALPGLNNQYLASAITGSDVNMAQYNVALNQLRKELPSEGDMNDMLNRFAEAALAELANVEKGEETVVVNGISEDQHVLTATITEADTARMVKAVLELAQNDATFQQLLRAVSNFANIMGAGTDLYTQVMAELPAAIAQLTVEMNTLTSGETIIIKTYINHDGEITGRIATLYSSGPAQEILNYRSATDNGVTQTQGTMGQVSFTGQKQTSGKVTTGNYTFTMESEEMFKLDVIETEDQSTEYRLTPGKGIINMLMQETGMDEDALAAMPDSIPSSGAISSAASPIAGLLAGSVSVSLTVSDPDVDNPSIALSAQLNGKSLFTLSLSSKASKSQDIAIPQSYVDSNDQAAAEAWLQSIDMTALFNKLRAAGVPEELVNELQNGLSLESSQTDAA